MKLKELIKKYGEYEIKNEEQILELLKKPKLKTVWDLKHDDDYYVLTTYGGVGQACNWDGDSFIETRRCGNIFLTKEEAEKELKRRECEALLKKHSNGYEFKCGDCNYFLYVSELMGSTPHCGVSYDDWIKISYVYFASEEEARNAIEAIGEERLLRDYFQIEIKNEHE